MDALPVLSCAAKRQRRLPGMCPSRFRPFLLLPPLGLRLPPINQKAETLYLMTDSKGRLWIHHQISFNSNLYQTYSAEAKERCSWSTQSSAMARPHGPRPAMLAIASDGGVCCKQRNDHCSKENSIKTSPLVESYDPHVLCAVRPDHPIGSSRAVLQQPEPRLN